MKNEDDSAAPTSFEALRAATLNNNLVWLKSFGCEIRHCDDSIYINHPQMRDYSAWLILGAPHRAKENLTAALGENKKLLVEPDIYVDDACSSAALETTLVEDGFKSISVSMTTAKFLSRNYAPTELTVQPADRSSFEQWTSLYSEGFNRHGHDAEVDRFRWLQSFESDDRVQHWFFTIGDRKVGVCQTCVCFGVVGIYSFTLGSGARGLRNLKKALRALRAKVAKQGETCVYWERLLPAGSHERRRRARSSSGIIVVRKLIGYRRFSDGMK
jgi:hypothetical protein